MSSGRYIDTRWFTLKELKTPLGHCYRTRSQVRKSVVSVSVDLFSLYHSQQLTFDLDILCPHHLSFPTFSLLYLLPYLSVPVRTDPLRFQGGYHNRRLNLVLVFLCSGTFLMFDECVLLLCFTATIRGEYRLPKRPTRETRLL